MFAAASRVFTNTHSFLLSSSFSCRASFSIAAWRMYFDVCVGGTPPPPTDSPDHKGEAEEEEEEPRYP